MGIKKPNVLHQISQKVSVVHFAYSADELPHDLKLQNLIIVLIKAHEHRQNVL